MSYTEAEQQRIAAYPRGTVVRVKDPDSYIASVASKLRNRLGEITGHTMPYGNPRVAFYAIGRRQEHRQTFSFGSVPELEFVTDAEVIAQWREEVRKTKEKADAKLAARKAAQKA